MIGRLLHDRIGFEQPEIGAAPDPGLYRRLDRLRLCGGDASGVRPGNNRVSRGEQASGMEVIRHASYLPGDDPRHLDWNAFSRLGELHVKRFRAEREIPVSILLDVSASMDLPIEDRKSPFARTIALALAYVAVRNRDPVTIVALSPFGSALLLVCPRVSHPGRFSEIQNFLAEVPRGGIHPIPNGIEAWTQHSRPGGRVIVISDFLAPIESCCTSLRRLTSPSGSVAVIRVLGPRERDASHLPARARLHDIESGRERVIAVTEKHIATYRAALEQHIISMNACCSEAAIRFAQVDPSRGPDHGIFHDLTRAGILY